jgi:hypothetical protein
MSWKKMMLPMKSVVIGGMLIGAILILTSTNYDKVNNEYIHSELTTENTKRLANTNWKLKYYDCGSCTGRADDLVLQDDGKGFLENIPVRWAVKDDTVNIITDPQYSCSFPTVLLADENLMFGTNFCSGDAKAANFIASKVNVANPTLSSTSNTTEEAANKNILSIFDKTYMFKRGFERVYGERKIDALIIHSSFCVNSLNPFDLYCVLAEYKRHGVAAHYLIDREGNIHRLVNENNVAFHAGFGKMPDGYNAINTRSMGIELINSETEGPNEAQYQALSRLVKDIKLRHKIKYIKGHSQIAPGRKSDPWKFNWKTFYESIKDDSIMTTRP